MITPEPVIHIVDDDESIRTSLARLLRALGYAVKIYASGTEFRAREADGRGGCLILDLRMPGMSGLELQEAVAGDPDPLPILFLTGHGDLHSCVRAMKGGAADFLTKPCKAPNSWRPSRGPWPGRPGPAGAGAEADLTARLDRLTPRELEVFRLVATGKLNKQIAAALGTTVRTVKAHRGQVMRKLGAVSVAELVKFAEQLQIFAERRRRRSACIDRTEFAR